MYTSPDEVRDAHPYFMYDEIKGQPAIHRTVVAPCAGVRSRAFSLARHGPGGCFWSVPALHCMQPRSAPGSFAPFLAARSRRRPCSRLKWSPYLPGLRPDDVVVAVSHSGTSTMTIRALERARRSGVETILITGFPESEAARVAQHVLVTGYDEEHSWAHTASYTAALPAWRHSPTTSRPRRNNSIFRRCRRW